MPSGKSFHTVLALGLTLVLAACATSGTSQTPNQLADANELVHGGGGEPDRVGAGPEGRPCRA